MKPYSLQESLRIRQLEHYSGSIPVQESSLYELLHIQSGKGEYILKGSRFFFQSGDLFWLTPTSRPTFRLHQPTRYCSISFTAVYINHLFVTNALSWNALAEHRSIKFRNSPEKSNLITLIDIVLSESLNSQWEAGNPVLESLMSTIVGFVMRYFAQEERVPAGQQLEVTTRLIQRIMTYVAEHITEPDSLRMEKMADVFNYSASHLGALFKQQAGESIQQFVIQYKLKQVEARLISSALTISQIADEFGFADVCHLNKLFKRYYHATPTNYRRVWLG